MPWFRRVTADVDQITLFLQWSGVTLIVSAGQVLVTTRGDGGLFVAAHPGGLRRVHSGRAGGAGLSEASGRCLRPGPGARRRCARGDRESIAGGTVIRAYRVSGRSVARLDTAIDRQRRQESALRSGVTAFSTGEVAAGVALAAVVLVGVWLGIAGEVSLGRLTAFLFLVTLFVHPVQVATEMLNEAQNAVAGWRRVLDVLDIAPDVSDPGPGGGPAGRAAGRSVPDGGLRLSGRHRSTLRCGHVASPRARIAVVGRDRGREDHAGQADYAADGSHPG